MSCTRHVLNFQWERHSWRQRVTASEVLTGHETDMWARGVYRNYTRCDKQDVCEVCGTNADTRSARTGTCQRCGGKLVQRSDDNEAVIRERLKVYERQTRPLVEYYQTSPTFRSVNGAQAPDRVTADLLSAVLSASGAAKGVQG